MHTPAHSPSALLASSGDPQLDTLLSGLLQLVELCLPGRLHSAYLTGSYAERSATRLSDLDATLVFQGQLAAAERERFKQLLSACKQIAPISLDIVCLSEDQLAGLASPAVWQEPLLIVYATSLLHCSQLIAGADLRAALPAVPSAARSRALMHFAYHVLAGQRGHPARLDLPLNSPDPTDEFLGYTQRPLRDRSGQLQPSTKRLVHASGFIATALLALSGRVVGSQRAAVRQYRAWIGDEWAALLEDIQRWCRVEWDYAVPAAPADRATLRSLCQRQLALERMFLARYIAYLLDELQEPDPAVQRFALGRLVQLSDDPAVTATLHRQSWYDQGRHTLNQGESMITVANRIYVHPDYAAQFEQNFHQRAGMVDQMPGFISNQVLRPVNEGDPYIVLTFWQSRSDFDAWVKSDAFVKGHARSGTLPREAFTGQNQLEIHEIIQDSTRPDLTPEPHGKPFRHE